MTLEEYTRPDTGALSRAVGARIREIRRSKNLTLNELARKCGTTSQTIQRLEVRNMTLSVDWIEIICIALNIEPYELFPHPDIMLRSKAEAMKSQTINFIESVDDFLRATD